jgi:biotin transport system substrate-specific component
MMTALTWCVIPYILPDLAKIAVALLIGSNKALRRVIRNGENA